MRKLLKIFGVLLCLALVWLGLVLSEWLPRPTQAELAAVAVLEAEPTNIAGARDAFPAIWLFGYDVPEAELEAVAAADAAAFLAATQRSGQVLNFKSTAEGKYPAIPAPPNTDPLLCDVWSSGCLTRVRANTAASRARVAEFAQRLERGDRLAQYDHYRYGFLPRYDSPIGGTNGLFALQSTSAALDYLDGNVDAAFARLCRDTATWRRLRAHSDALIQDMLGVAQMTGATRLYAEMLAEQPADFAPPCPETFAPLSDAEVNQCTTLRQEYFFLLNTVRHPTLGAELIGGGKGPQLYFAMLNKRHVMQASAPAYANQCGVENQERVRRRDPTPIPVTLPCGAMAWTFDPVGCHLALTELPSFNEYFLRVLDLDARLKLLQSAIWLRAQPAAADVAAPFAARPIELQSAAHVMTHDAERGVLRMTNLHKSKGEHWELPYASTPPATAAPPPEAADVPGSGGR